MPEPVMRWRTRCAEDDGVTLIESLVVIILMAVIGSVVLTSVVRAMTASTQTQLRFDGLAALQMSVDRMTRELRAADPLDIAQSSSSRSVANVYRSNFSQHLRFTYQYCPAQGQIHVRSEGPTPAPTAAPAAIACGTTTEPIMITGVANGAVPLFEYLTAALTPAATIADVDHIRVTVRRSLATPPALTCDPATDGDCIEVTTLVKVRNAR